MSLCDTGLSFRTEQELETTQAPGSLSVRVGYLFFGH